jgi:hypothetical protein
MLKKLFVPYEQSLALKELGFDEPCMYYVDEQNNSFIYNFQTHPDEFIEWCGVTVISTPLYQQAFRWFREKYEYYYHIFPLQITASDKTGYRYSWEIYNHTPEWITEDRSLLGSLTYEEAELACLKKLIEIVKK